MAKSKIEAKGIDQAFGIFSLSQYMREPILLDYREDLNQAIKTLVVDRIDPLLLWLVNAKGRVINQLKIDDIYLYLKNTSVYAALKSFEDDKSLIIYRFKDGSFLPVDDVTKKVLIEISKTYDSKNFVVSFDLIYLIRSEDGLDVYRYLLSEDGLLYLKSIDNRSLMSLIGKDVNPNIIVLPVINVFRVALAFGCRAPIYALISLGIFIGRVTNMVASLGSQLGRDMQATVFDGMDALESMLNIRDTINLLAPVGVLIRC